MEIVWDPIKAKTNLLKHRIRFSDAEYVLYDPLALTIEDEVCISEQRFITIGVDGFARALVVVHCCTNQQIRIISARKADKYEVNCYEEDK